MTRTVWSVCYVLHVTATNGRHSPVAVGSEVVGVLCHAEGLSVSANGMSHVNASWAAVVPLAVCWPIRSAVVYTPFTPKIPDIFHQNASDVSGAHAMVHVHSCVRARMVSQAPASPLARTPPSGSARL
jgi:hypothetical protein